MKLKPRQEAFCLEFAKHGNATEAYLKAFGTDNERTAGVQASRMIKKPSVQERLAELASEIKQKKIADVIECQEMLTAIARNVEEDTAERIKAIQILLKVQGAFVTQIKFDTTPIVISGGDQLED